MQRFADEGEAPAQFDAILHDHLILLRQAHAILTEIKGEAPSLDLPIYQYESGISMIRGAGGDFSRPEKRPG
jgi:hypothetical protein